MTKKIEVVAHKFTGNAQSVFVQHKLEGEKSRLSFSLPDEDITIHLRGPAIMPRGKLDQNIDAITVTDLAADNSRELTPREFRSTASAILSSILQHPTDEHAKIALRLAQIVDRFIKHPDELRVLKRLN